jgi:hypothetical protein
MADDAKGPAFVDFYFVIAHDGWDLLSFTVLNSLFIYVFTGCAARFTLVSMCLVISMEAEARRQR